MKHTKFCEFVMWIKYIIYINIFSMDPGTLEETIDH